MLNIQIRGAKIKIAVGSINQKQVKGLFNQISEKKCSLADIMLSSQWELHNDIFSSATPIITSDAELIITSYDSNDYYNEGHSFFRSRVTDVIQDIPVQKLIDYKNQSYLIAHCAIYYGNSFETELDDLDYQYFNENTISINTSVYPFYRLPLIHDFYLNNLKLVDLERQKIDQKQFISTIYKNKSSNETGKLLTENFSRFYEPIIDSKIDIGPK